MPFHKLPNERRKKTKASPELVALLTSIIRARPNHQQCLQFDSLQSVPIVSLQMEQLLAKHFTDSQVQRLLQHHRDEQIKEYHQRKREEGTEPGN